MNVFSATDAAEEEEQEEETEENDAAAGALTLHDPSASAAAAAADPTSTQSGSDGSSGGGGSGSSSSSAFASPHSSAAATRWSPSHFRSFRKTVISAILSTDMSKHFALCKQLDSQLPDCLSLDANKEEDRQFMIDLLTHSADLSAQVLPYELAVAWEARLTREFSAQAELEMELGLPVSSFMQNLHDPVVRFKNHLNFLGHKHTSTHAAAACMSAPCSLLSFLPFPCSALSFQTTLHLRCGWASLSCCRR